MQKTFSPLLQIGLCTFGCLYATSNTALAQVTPDGTVNTQVTQNGNVAEITGGETRGSNLFHSFQNFSVPTNNEAFFNNADSISNIFSRVTGGNISNIDGLIRANGSADLFLINPAGIIFGENARLDVGGSFLGTTATSILFDSGEFSAADLENPPLLTINAPIGLGFRDNPGDITVRGDGQGTRTTTEIIDTEDALRVDSDETFALLGGDINFEGATIKTAGGRIELVSIAANERVGLTTIDESFAFNYEGTQNFSNIQLSQTATVDASGEGGGNIRIQGRNITLTDGSTIEASTIGSLPGGSLDVTATDSLEIIGRSGVFTGFYSQVYTGAKGNAGNVTINANNILNVENGSQISAETFGEGNAGNVTINANNIIVTNNLSAADKGSQISSSTFGEGNAGNVTINANNISFDGISSEGFPSGAFSVVEADAEGNGGNVNVTANRLSLTNGGEVSVLTFGEGNGGNLNLTVADSITIGDITETTASGLYASAILGSGNGGSITVSTNNLTIQNQGTIGASNFQTSNRFPPGTGATGSINIEARSIELNSLGNISADSASGNGGNVSIRADSLTLDDRALISVFNRAGVGKGGNINLELNETLFMRKGLAGK